LNLLYLVLVNSSGEISYKFSFVRSVFFVESCFGVAVDGMLTLPSRSAEFFTKKVALDSLAFFSSSTANVSFCLTDLIAYDAYGEVPLDSFDSSLTVNSLETSAIVS